MNALPVQTALGKGRDCIQLQAHLRGLGLSMSGVSRAVGIHHSLVRSTLCGTANNRKVLAYLIKKGVHPRVLFPMAFTAPDEYRPAIDRLVEDMADMGVQLAALQHRRAA